ncbi:TetR/AcrR family transcriptional regulator [Cryptosporangium sp. NPDC051539]|uniref:TetR/AcrR family transcriptional regulator n=1 Tax=Cryptosporangium sp. NPDC051539 TaxID=3363962 RepID=UPI0037B44C07
MARAQRADAVRNADAILAAAEHLFSERGPDVPFDEIARRAGVGNATLYRHFPTRSDLLVAVYGDQVAELCRRADRRPDGLPPEVALFDWLDEFVLHVVSKRDLALAITETADGRRSALFEQWHATISATAAGLLTAAQAGGAVRPEITARDLLALLSAVAVAGTDAEHARRLLGIVRHGLEP